MIAYNKEWLHNIDVKEELENLLSQNILTKDEAEAALALHPVGFYMPNYFIRVGLFALTVVIVGFSLGLFLLAFTLNSGEKGIGGLLIFFGMVTYLVLELMIKGKQNYQAGVDDALLYLSGILLVSGINMITDVSSLGNSIIILFIALFFTIRFTDKLMALTASLALFAVLFFILVNVGGIAKAVTPFALMTLAALIYSASKFFVSKISLSNYKYCFLVAEITVLICFYIAGNYFVVRETSNEFFNLGLQPGDSIPFAWLFWIFTCAIPIIYILRGIQKKDMVLIRVGILLVAAIVFTVRYYHSILPLETVMVIAGFLLLAVSYALIKILQQPKAGFTSEVLHPSSGGLNLEALIIAETLSSATTQEGGTTFGGGDFGGGGASGEY